MAIEMFDTMKPKGDFPIAEAEDIALPDGSRLSGQPIIKTVTELPEDAAEHPDVLYLVIEQNSSETPEVDGDSGEPSGEPTNE
ncbi:MAG: hypothetical protein NC395_12095 [Prevotella sp.]|nr:hypothetical protein [Prevotella sp.]